MKQRLMIFKETGIFVSSIPMDDGSGFYAAAYFQRNDITYFLAESMNENRSTAEDNARLSAENELQKIIRQK